MPGDGIGSTPADPVTVQLRRDGWTEETLFLVPGLEGRAEELDLLIDSLIGGQSVYVVSPPMLDASELSVDLVRIAGMMACAIRRKQMVGPYKLGGYSYGGLLAYEIAQQLRAAGEAVSDLFLVDVVYDERYWPKLIWVESLLRRTGRQMAEIASLPPKQAGRELLHRSDRLVQRILRRRTAAPEPLRACESTVARQAYVAMSTYRPAYYDGPVTLVASSVDRHFGLDTPRLWSTLVSRLSVQRVVGDHLAVIRDRTSAATVAGVIDYQLGRSRPDWLGLRPISGFERPMIVTTMKWFSAARLAYALVESGFGVSACHPRSHPIEVVDGVRQSLAMKRFGRVRSIQRAIDLARPDIVLADDERALMYLRRLYAVVRFSDPQLAELIAKSIGTVADWGAISSRTGVAETARELSVPVPTTSVVTGPADVRSWSRAHGLPMVLKTDGSWGGRGVAVVKKSDEIDRAWRSVGRPPSLTRAVKRLVVNLEAGPLIACVMRTAPVVNAQTYISGREAIATVACLNGRVLSIACFEVRRAMPNHGAATAIEVVDDPRMRAAAEALVGRLGLSGFCGMDFMVTDTGEPVLLELNPRVTPTAYLLVEGNIRINRTIVLFPADPTEWATYAVGEEVDIPVRSPALVDLGESLVARRSGLVARAERWFSQRRSA